MSCKPEKCCDYALPVMAIAAVIGKDFIIGTGTLDWSFIIRVFVLLALAGLAPLTGHGRREIIAGFLLAMLSILFFDWLGAATGHGWLAWLQIVPIAVFLWVLWFFRDPERIIPQESGILVSPADGTITHVDEVDEPSFIGGRALRCSIFLSIFSVHINRAPAAGKVAYLQFVPGEFFDARREESLTKNQNQDMGLETDEPSLPRRILVRQSTGAIARRIVCPLEIGKSLARGDRYGMIKFGSRTTMFIPADCKMAWTVKVGDTVKAGATILARATEQEK